MWRRLARNRMSLACGVLVLLVCAFSFLGPILAQAIAGLDGVSQDPRLGATPPSWGHWMGTDPLGRDLLVRTMEGGRYAIGIGLIAAAIALVIGVTWGAVAGWAGGKTDEAMMRFVDVLYALPSPLFVIVVMAVFETRSLFSLFALLGAISWLTMARIVRGQVLSLKRREFVDAARALGAPARWILSRHIVPNTIGPIVVYLTLTIPAVMLHEAFLSFLGLGVQAPRASWGTLVLEGTKQMIYPWLLLGPGLVMSATIFALNFLGDGLRDAMDPHGR
jgi:oligopeptide transport system permease protein